jgi:hypothetical protein
MHLSLWVTKVTDAIGEGDWPSLQQCALTDMVVVVGCS